jgi:hypothetical protein
MAAIASERNAHPLSSLMNNPVDFHAPQAYFEASSTPQSLFEVALAEEHLYVLDTDMEMEPEVEADSCKIHHALLCRTNNEVIVCLGLSAEFNFGGASNFDWPAANSLSPTTITGQSFTFSAVSSPRPQSAGQGLSPFSQFVNLEVIDTRPDFQLLTNLPYFRLQSLLEQSGVITPLFPA